MKESVETYKIYISKVPKQEHPDVSVDSKVMSIMNSFVSVDCKVMSIMNSFVSDIFKKLAGPAPATCRVCPGECAS